MKIEGRPASKAQAAPAEAAQGASEASEAPKAAAPAESQAPAADGYARASRPRKGKSSSSGSVKLRPPKAKASASSDVDEVAQPLIDALRDNEALTENCQDTEAERLLKWGEERVKKVVQEALQIDDPQQRQEKLDAGMQDVRRRMRQVNQAMEDAYDGDADPAEKLNGLLAKQGG